MKHRQQHNLLLHRGWTKACEEVNNKYICNTRSGRAREGWSWGEMSEQYVSVVTLLKVTEMPGHPTRRGESNHAVSVSATHIAWWVYSVGNKHSETEARPTSAVHRGGVKSSLRGSAFVFISDECAFNNGGEGEPRGAAAARCLTARWVGGWWRESTLKIHSYSVNISQRWGGGAWTNGWRPALDALWQELARPAGLRSGRGNLLASRRTSVTPPSSKGGAK